MASLVQRYSSLLYAPAILSKLLARALASPLLSTSLFRPISTILAFVANYVDRDLSTSAYKPRYIE
jgi:hypothetical protein